MATFNVISSSNVISGSGGSSYLVYTALLSQSGTDAPTSQILQNTLGVVPTFTYEGTGEWTIQRVGGWDNTKTWFCFQSPSSYGEVSASMVGAQIINDPGSGFNNVIYLNIKNSSGGFSNMPTDYKMPIEIRVYTS